MIVKNGQNLIVTENQEYQLHIVDIDDNLPKDFFYETYRSAFVEVGKIIAENDRQKDLQESANNIIAFCGERGQGKSSAMLSFSKLLKNISDAERYFGEEVKNISRNQFFVLQRIDPTELEKNHSILSVIIARIFFEFKQILEKGEMHSSALQHSLIQSFNRCFHDVGIIKDEHRKEPIEYEYEDDIENLSQLSDAANMKKDFHDLVDEFLTFKCGGNSKKFLVIQIDDTDLNIRKAYEIVEDIRKYFMMPNVLILMAANITLLSQAIDQDFRKKFKLSLETAGGILTRDTYKMTSQYINKLLPGSRRINLPRISSADLESTDKEITITYQRQTSDNRTVNIFNYTYKDGRKIDDLQESVLRFIYEKTGLVFVKTVDAIHKIIPSNTRSLANFLSMLNSMPDISGDLGDINEMFFLQTNENREKTLRTELIDQRIQNLKAFEEYFVDTWIKENLENEYGVLFNEWLALPYNEKNSYIINFVYNKIKISEMNANSTRRQEKKPSHSIKATDDYSLGNVLYLLEDFAQSGGETLRNFTFAVQTFYSIMLNKWFCNHIKNQKNETSDFKKTDIVDFVGNLYTQYFIRAVPDIDKSDDGLSIDYRVRVKPEVFAHKFFNKTNPEHLSNSFISAFFGNVPIKIKSSEYYNYTFNMATFIQRFLEPQAYITEFANWNSTINAVNVGENNSDRKNETNLDFFDADEMKGIRIFCFILTTNLDIASALLRTRIRTVRTPPSAECLKRVVENLQKEVHTWAYLPIWHYDLDILIATFDSAQGFIDYIFNLQPYENNDKSKLRNSVGLLFNVAPDVDMESLVSKIDIITNVMYSIQDNFPVIDLTLEINELERILENAEKARKLNRPWSAKTCDTYRQTLNRMSNSAKAKGERFLND